MQGYIGYRNRKKRDGLIDDQQNNYVPSPVSNGYFPIFEALKKGILVNSITIQYMPVIDIPTASVTSPIHQ